MLNNENEDYNLDLDLDFIGKNKKSNKRIFRPKKSNRIFNTRVKYKNAKKLVEDLGNSVERAFCYLEGSFIFGDFIEAFIEDNNLYADEITIATLSINQDNVDSLANLLHHNRLDNLNLIVSDYYYSHNRHNVKYIYEELDIKNSFQFAVMRTHCKLCLIGLKDGRKFVIHGSANLRSNKCIEMFEIEENKELYDFHYEIQKEYLDIYNTINKKIKK